MLFKRKGSDEEENKYDSLDDDELALLRYNQLKKINRRTKIRNILFYIVVFIGIIGGYKGLLSNTGTDSHEEVENASFAEEYVNKYYKYPRTDEEKEYIDNFTYTKNSNATLDFKEGIEYAKMNNVHVYKVQDTDNENILSYFLTGDYEIKIENKKSTTTTLNCKVDIAKVGTDYKVINPVSNVAYEQSAILDEDKLNVLKLEKETSSTGLEDDELEETKNTINLFIKTYNDDIVQARLLTTSSDVLNVLDSNTKLELESITSANKDEEKIYVTANLTETYNDLITKTNSYYFVLNIENNKIETMEVY